MESYTSVLFDGCFVLCILWYCIYSTFRITCEYSSSMLGLWYSVHRCQTLSQAKEDGKADIYAYISLFILLIFMNLDYSSFSDLCIWLLKQQVSEGRLWIVIFHQIVSFSPQLASRFFITHKFTRSYLLILHLGHKF